MKMKWMICWALLLGGAMACHAQKPELVVQTGHRSSVDAVAFSPDSKILASAAHQVIKIWGVSTGDEIRTFISGQVRCLCFSPDGKKLAVADWSRHRIDLIEVINGKLLRSFRVSEDQIYTNSLTFSADGSILVSGDSTGHVNLWNVYTGKLLRRWEADRWELNTVIFSPDGRVLASGGDDHTVKLWSLATGKILRTLVGQKGPIASISFDRAGKTLSSCSSYGTVMQWDLRDGRQLHLFKGGRYVLSSFASDAQTIAIADRNQVHLRQVATGKVFQDLRGHKGSIESLCFNKNGHILASGSVDETIKLWNMADGKEIRTLSGQESATYCLAFANNGNFLASGQSDGTIKLWDLRSGKILFDLKGHAEAIIALVISSDNKFLISGSSDCTIKLWNVSDGKELYSFQAYEGRPQNEKYFASLALSPDNKLLAASASHELIKIWDIENKRFIRTMKGTGLSLRFSPDGKTLAANNIYEPTSLFDVNSGNIIASFKEGGNNIRHGLDFNPSGNLLADGSRMDGVPLWDVSSGQSRILQGPLAKKGDGEYVSESYGLVCFSPDGNILAAGDDGNAIFSRRISSVTLWDVSTTKVLRTFGAHEEGVTALCFSPSGNTLASAGGDRTIKLWDTATGREIVCLFSMDDDWAIVEPEGRFDASPGGMEQMHYVKGLEPIGLDQFKDGFYEPGLLAKVLGFNKEPLRAVSNLADLKLYPEVTPKIEGDKLVVDLENQGGGIGAVQVLINGKELEADARGGKVAPDAANAEVGVLLNGPMIVPGADNQIEVIARNADGTLASRGFQLLYHAPGRKEVKPPHLYAIVCGVSQFADPDKIQTLRFAAKDASDMAKAISLAGGGLFGANNVHVSLFTGEASTPPAGALPSQPATKDNLRKAFAEVAQKATPDDLLLVYFSGHGVTLGQGSSTYCYLTQDARTTELKGSPFLKDWTVSSEELAEWTKKIGALKQVLILDTCAAGAAADKLVERKDLSGDAIRAIERMKDRVGFHVLMGSAADAVSYEAGRYDQGLLTYALLEGMRGRSLREDKFVDVTKWFDFAEDEVPKLAGDIGGIQRPQIAAPQGSSFDVGALSTPEARAAIPLSVSRPQLLRPRLSDEDSPDLFDTLGLETLLRAKLREASLVTARDGSTPVFVDAAELPGAIAVGGRYKVEGEKIRVTLGLRRDGKSIGAPLVVEGVRNDLPGLVEKLADKLNAAVIVAP